MVDFLLHGSGPVLEMSNLTFTVIEVPALVLNVISLTILKPIEFLCFLLLSLIFIKELK